VKKVGIYGLRNVVTGKWYIGQSIDVTKRHKGHEHSLRFNRHNNHRIVTDYNLHGWASFEFHLIEECPEAVLDARERAWIEFYGSCDPLKGYNLDSGGSFYKRHSQETRDKIAAARRGKPHPHKGRRLTKAEVDKMHAANKPKKHTIETRRKMSRAGLARYGTTGNPRHKSRLEGL
jgi:group I intron endonuclease